MFHDVLNILALYCRKVDLRVGHSTLDCRAHLVSASAVTQSGAMTDALRQVLVCRREPETNSGLMAAQADVAIAD